MGKLGKKARKFAKKNLQSVLKRKRQLKSIFKRKKSSRDKGDTAEDQLGPVADPSNGRNSEGEDFGDTSLAAIFGEDDSSSLEDASDSDGFLSEDSSCPYTAENENGNDSGENSGHSSLLGQNKEIHLELAKQKKKLDRLRKKDSDEEDKIGDLGSPEASEDCSHSKEGKDLTSSTIDSWCQLVMGQNCMSALPNLLNGYRAACQYGTDSLDQGLCWRIQKSEPFCKILMFMLCEAEGIFRRLLGISSTKKETMSELKNTSKWITAKPIIKSYLRSTLFLLNQVTDTEILGFAITRLRASIIFSTAFPSLLRRLIKVVVHLWATGGGTVSSSSFLLMRDVAFLPSSDCFNTCLIKAYKAFIAHCKFVEPSNLNHIGFLRDFLVELFSIDAKKSFNKALVSVQQLAKILQQGLKTKKKEALKKIYNWQYANCIDLWVKFISANIRDHDLQPLLYLIIQVISGVAHLFPGPRYFPLRLKCIQMLNQLSFSSGFFIPVSSLVLDSLEYRGSGKADARSGKTFNFSSVLKVPKQWLKSLEFQEGCVLSAIELLSAHFAQWSYHISFPELATIPLIRLRKFYEKTTAEILRRPVKRLMDQVEQNVEYVQKKRDEIVFSPKDLESVESFLQLEKCSGNAPFTQYYKSILQNSISRNAVIKEKISVLGQKESRKQPMQIREHGMGGVIGERDIEKEKVNPIVNERRDGRKRKKQRT